MTRLTHEATGGLARPSRIGALGAVLIAGLALAACGESAEAKAKKQVCSARDDIAQQLTTLGGLTLGSGSASAAKSSFEAIGRDVAQIKAAQGKLEPGRRQQVEAATHAFIAQLNAIAAGLASNLSPSNAAAQFRTALSQLAADYRQTLGPINCE